MQLPLNMGMEYTTAFKELFINVAQQNNIQLIPFLLKDVGRLSSLKQNDGIHPNVAGHKKWLINNLWKVLKPYYCDLIFAVLAFYKSRS